MLHRRSLRSLGLFMDEVSELMQCLIRKLYTMDGHKVRLVSSGNSNVIYVFYVKSKNGKVEPKLKFPSQFTTLMSFQDI